MSDTPPWDQPKIEFCGPAIWRGKKRPIALSTTHDQTLIQLSFDVLFAGAKSAGGWEDEWPLMSEDEFDAALEKVATLELGGQRPNGSHPRAE